MSDLQDIIRLIRNKPALETTKFCVTACTRLPAVSLEHIDVSALLSQISELRMQINKFQNIQQQVDELSNSIFELKNSGSKIRSPCQNVQKVTSTTPSVKEIINKLEVNNCSLNDKRRLIRGKSLENFNKCESNLDQAKESLYPDLSEFRNNASQSLNCSVANDDYEGNFLIGEVDSELESNTEISQLQNYWPSRTIYSRKRTDHKWQSNRAVDRTQHRKDSYIGPFPNSRSSYKRKGETHHLIKAAGHRFSSNINYKTGLKLFVSRVDLEETNYSVRRHIVNICGGNTKIFVQKIETSNPNFNSFKVVIRNKPNNIDLLNLKHWPSGILVRVFKE